MEQVKTLNILQHNVLSWNKHKYALYNTYRLLDPHIILLNAHGCKHNQEMKIYNYTVVKNNKTNNLPDGAAIAIRKDIKVKLVSLDRYHLLGFFYTLFIYFFNFLYIFLFCSVFFFNLII